MSGACENGGVLHGPPGLSAKARIVSAFILVISLTVLDDHHALLAFLVPAALLALFTLRERGTVLKNLMHIEGFLLVLLLVLPFTVPGEPIAALGPLSISAQGAERAVSIFIRVNAAALVILSLLSGVEPVRLGSAMRSLGLPESLTRLFLMTARYISLFREETHRLLQAMRARGFVPSSSRHGWKTLGNLTGMMLVRSLERSERVEDAMRARGFSGLFPSGEAEPRGRFDIAFITLASCLCAAAMARSWL